MAPYVSSFNSTTNGSLMAASAYGKTWPLGFPSHSNKNFSFNDFGLQGHQISGFSSHPHGPNSLYHHHHQRNNNNPLMFNYLNPNRVYTNNIHITNPSFVPPIQVQHLELLSPKDLTRERAMKRPLCEFQDIDTIASASKRSKMSFDLPYYCEGKQLQEMLLLKDEEHPLSTPKSKTYADKKNLDLSLCI